MNSTDIRPALTSHPTNAVGTVLAAPRQGTTTISYRTRWGEKRVLRNIPVEEVAERTAALAARGYTTVMEERRYI